jgi:hypothetical protein
MTVTYKMGVQEITPEFWKGIADIFKNKVVRIKVEDTGEYYNADGLLVRGGVTIPGGREKDPLYSSLSIKRMNESLHQLETGQVVHKTITELAQ